jgi:hypothetical protein
MAGSAKRTEADFQAWRDTFFISTVLGTVSAVRH